jgi:hypothetical protein
MKTTLRELKLAESSIRKLIKQGALSAKYQYRLKFLIKEIDLFDKTRQELATKVRKQFADEDIIPEKELKELNEQIEDLAGEEIEVRFISLDANELIKKKDSDGEPVVKLDAEDWYKLEPYIEGEPNFEEIEENEVKKEVTENVVDIPKRQPPPK